MKIILFAVVSLICVASFGSTKPIDVIVDEESILQNPNLSKSQKSLLLTQQGEWLMTSDSFFLPFDIFTKALDLDSDNIKARIYVAAINPFMSLKGILTRLDKLASKSPEASKS